MSENTIKTYQQIDKDKEHVYFKVQHMSSMYTDRNGTVDEAHRHDYYTVLVVNKAKGKHIIDFSTYAMNENQVFFVSPGQVHQVIEEKASEGFILLFTNDFLIENNIPIEFIENLNLFRPTEETPPLKLNQEANFRINMMCELLMDYKARNIKFNSDAQGALLKLLLIECNNSCFQPFEENTQVLEAGNTVLRRFKKLINQKYRDLHNVQEYAELLHITPDHLNRTIKQLTGKTAKEHLDARLVIAAKRLLHFSECSNKEISFALGFNEPGHFSTFFKKQVGVTPSQYKKQ